MNADFPRIITLQRKERKISQKQAAADLGISQALLSHYEKGIRECGLDFLVKTADYYNVSCDYLLGRTPSPDRQFIPHENTQSAEDDGKMISESVSLILSLCSDEENSKLEKESADYIMLCLYRLFRIIYHSNEENNCDMFKLPQIIAEDTAAAGIMKACAAIRTECSENFSKNITTSGLSEKFPQSDELLKLIKFSEEKLSGI